MNLCIAENCQLLRREIATHWKTGAVMISVAIVVGHVYGHRAAMGVLLITVSNYQIIGQQFRIISWMSLRKTLVAFVVFGNGYYNVISPQIVSFVAFGLMLIDNLQLSGINADLSSQNETLKENNDKLKAAYESLKTLEAELQKLLGPVSHLQAAQDANTAKGESLNETVPEDIQNIPARLDRVAAFLKQLMSAEEMQETIKFETELRSKISSMLLAFSGVIEDLQPVTAKVDELSMSLGTTVSNLGKNVVITGKQIEALQDILKKAKSFSQRRVK